MPKGVGREQGKPRAALDSRGAPLEPEHGGQAAAHQRLHLTQTDRVGGGTRTPRRGREDAHLSLSSPAARTQRHWGCAAGLITRGLSTQSKGYYLHRILLGLGPKKIHRTAVGL